MTGPTAYDVLQVRPNAHPDVVRAAYRALARIHHPDTHPEEGATLRMAELNRAYAALASDEARAAYDRGLRQSATPPSPPSDDRPAPPPTRVPPPGGADTGSGALDFGRYAGWTIAQLVRHDPDYLRWLRRHSSGIRYRREIDDRLPEGGGLAQARPRHRFSPFRSRRSAASA